MASYCTVIHQRRRAHDRSVWHAASKKHAVTRSDETVMKSTAQVVTSPRGRPKWVGRYGTEAAPRT